MKVKSSNRSKTLFFLGMMPINKTNAVTNLSSAATVTGRYKLYAVDKKPLIDPRLGLDYFLNVLPILPAGDLNHFSLGTQFFRDL